MFETVVSIPSPPSKVKVSAEPTVSLAPESAAIVKSPPAAVQPRFPAPSVFKTWLLLPSPSGNVQVTLVVTAFGALNAT